MSFSKSKLGVRFNRYELSICKKYFHWVVWLGDSLLCVKQPNILLTTYVSNKKWGWPCSFSRHNADEYGYLGPFSKNCAQPKTRQTEKERFFPWYMMYCTEFDLNVLFSHLSTMYSLTCLLMSLFLLYAPKWPQIRHALVDPLLLNPNDSVDLLKKTEQRFKSIFFPLKGSTVLPKIRQ